jgi:MFS family permease
MPAEPRPPRDIGSWKRSVLGVFALTGFGIANWLSRIPAARDELHASAFQMGTLAFGIAAGSIAGFALAGRLAGRRAPRTIITGALCVSVLGLAGAGAGVTAPGGLAWAMIALVLLGLGNGTCNVVMNVEGAAIEHALRHPVMPRFHAMYSAGVAAGAGVGALCAAAGVPPAAQLIPVAAAIGLILPAVTRALSTAPPVTENTGTENTENTKSQTQPGKAFDGRTLLIGVVVLGMSFANGAANDWIALGMVDGHGVAQGAAAATVNVFSLAVVAARLSGSRALVRLGRTRTVQISAITGLGGVLLFILAPTALWAFAGSVLWGLGVALAFPIGMSAAGDDPRHAARRIAVVAAIGYAGSLAGPPLIGFIAGRAGILHALLIVPVLVAAAGLASPVLRPRPLPRTRPLQRHAAERPPDRLTVRRARVEGTDDRA